MNIEKLRAAEGEFLMQYPDGFADEGLVKVGKRHKVGQMTTFCQEVFRRDAFKDTGAVLANMTKVISRASMVSMFEKPKFRDLVAGLNQDDRARLADALKGILHGREAGQKRGFESLVELLGESKLAKWSLVTIVQNYYHPDREVFVKPTTAKGVIEVFELEGVTYRPRPTWEFYTEYRRQILEMRALVDPRLAPNNAAFCGFLMMSMRPA